MVGRPFWTETQRPSAAPWCCGASFWETEQDFPFSAQQTLGNLAEYILTPLAI